jgi:hypothetical protein
MSQTAARITADQYYAQVVEGDRKQLVEGEIFELAMDELFAS